MLPTEQDRFIELVSDALGAYAKEPTAKQLESWWRVCKPLSLSEVERAIAAHIDDAEAGRNAPRPADVIRRARAGVRDGGGCAAADVNTRCTYPGVFSDATDGRGSWFCPWHRAHRSGPEASRFIEASLNVDFAEAARRRIDRMQREATRASAVVNTSHAIAVRHGDRPWQRALPFEGLLEGAA